MPSKVCWRTVPKKPRYRHSHRPGCSFRSQTEFCLVRSFLRLRRIFPHSISNGNRAPRVQICRISFKSISIPRADSMYCAQPASSAPGPSGPDGMIRETMASRDCRSEIVRTPVGLGVPDNLREEAGTNAQAIVAAVPARHSRRLKDWICFKVEVRFVWSFRQLPTVITLIG